MDQFQIWQLDTKNIIYFLCFKLFDYKVWEILRCFNKG